MVPYMDGNLLVSLAERLLAASDLRRDPLVPVFQALRAFPEAVADFCSRNFEKLLSVHRNLHFDEAGSLVADFTERVLPVGVAIPAGVNRSDRPPRQIFSTAEALHISQLCAGQSPTSEEGRVLASLIYRFPEVNEYFLSLNTKFDFESALVPPLVASLDIISAVGVDSFGPSKAKDLSGLESVLFKAAPTVSQWVLQGTHRPEFIFLLGKIIHLSSRIFPSLGPIYVSNLRENFTSGAPAIFTPEVLECLSQLVPSVPAAIELLKTFVEAGLEWLVRRFAEDEYNTAPVEAFVGALSECVDNIVVSLFVTYIRGIATADVLRGQSPSLALRWHFVEPVLSAGIQNRLEDTISLELLRQLSLNSSLTVIYAWQ
jgi:hypothetical protein